MDLTTDELDYYIKQISTGSKIVTVQGVDLVFKQPSNSLKMKADYIKKKAYDKAIDLGLLPLSELEELIEKRGIITESDKKNIQRLENRLKGQKTVLNKTQKAQKNIDKLNKVILDIEKQIYTIKYKRLSKMYLSADVKADEEAHIFLSTNSIYKFDNESELYWKDYSSYSLDDNIKLKQAALDKYIDFYRGVSTEIIRYIARHNLWRIRYITSVKTSEPLFGVATSDYTDDMLSLAFWSNFYSNIYEMLPEDRPSDAIIEDDDALDSFMSVFYDQREKESLARRGKNQARGKGKMTAFNNEEVIVTRSNEMYEDLKYDTPKESQRVKNRNTVSNRKKRRR